jgi:hypothetical protein
MDLSITVLPFDVSWVRVRFRALIGAGNADTGSPC